MEKLEIQKEPTGRLTLVHKVVLTAFGDLLIWIGKALKRVDTYETFRKMSDEVEKKIDDFNIEHQGKLEEVFKPEQLNEQTSKR